MDMPKYFSLDCWICTNDLEILITEFKETVIDKSVTILTDEVTYLDGSTLSVAEVKATVYNWNYYQQIIYNYVQAMEQSRMLTYFFDYHVIDLNL